MYMYIYDTEVIAVCLCVCVHEKLSLDPLGIIKLLHNIVNFCLWISVTRVRLAGVVV